MNLTYSNKKYAQVSCPCADVLRAEDLLGQDAEAVAQLIDTDFVHSSTAPKLSWGNKKYTQVSWL
jgi:hypothetical protein